MKKSIVILLFALTATFFCSMSFGEDRYEYIGKGIGQSIFYIDKYSISPTSVPSIFRCWCKEVVSDARRKELIASKNFSNPLYKLSYIMCCYEINIIQNTFNLAEAYMYDTNGDILDKALNHQSEWHSIPPNSVLETICNIVKRIIQNNTYRSPRQPFVTPQPRVQPQTPLNNQEQREEYSKLLEYISWLIAQPDYPEFDRWVSQKMIQAGVTPTQVNAGIEEYIRLSGGKYSDIRAMLAGWYREFYMEQYGKH